MSAEQVVRACAESNDGNAWDEFVSRFHRPISLSIIRVARQWGYPAQEVVDDLIQDTYLKLCTDGCRQLLEFTVKHPEALVGYIKTIAVNLAHDYFKAIHSRKRGSGEVSQFIGQVEPKAQVGSKGGQEAIERDILLEQIKSCLETCTEGPEQERDCLIFWLYYQQGMSAKAIAALPRIGLSAKGVESAIFRLTRLVREHLVDLRSTAGTESKQGGKGFHPAESY
jgi:RNA polymerase sigma-70 factor, ECF subfamily